MPKYLMRCGHVDNAMTSDGKPCCVICAGANPGAYEVDRQVRESEGLEGRTARCNYCGRTTPSKWCLPFFEYKPNSEFDEYYDGCFGWD